MFNVYLPKLLEKRLGDAGGGEGSRKEALWDIVIFTLGGCPGALVCHVLPWIAKLLTRTFRLVHG
jgi:hypothetical protein